MLYVIYRVNVNYFSQISIQNFGVKYIKQSLYVISYG